MSGLGMANLDEYTSKQNFNNKVGKRKHIFYAIHISPENQKTFETIMKHSPLRRF